MPFDREEILLIGASLNAYLSSETMKKCKQTNLYKKAEKLRDKLMEETENWDDWEE